MQLAQTCNFVPAQWEGRTADDRPVYIRGRGGILSVRVGPVAGSVWDGVRGEELVRIPREDADVLSSDEVRSVIADVLDFSKLEQIEPFNEWS